MYVNYLQISDCCLKKFIYKSHQIGTMESKVVDHFTSRAGDNDDGRLHSSTLLMSSIRYCNAGECLLTCYSCLFLPPLKYADTGLLSNTSGGYGQTVRHSFTCRHTWKAQELWRKRTMFSPLFSIINNKDEHFLEDVHPRNPHGLLLAGHKHQNRHV